MNPPSQKLFLVAIPVIVIVGLFVMFHGSKTPANQVAGTEIGNAPKVVSVQNSIVGTVDTDGDGVPDWEEIIWHTDPNNPETYGMPDKEYIAQQITAKQAATSTSSTVINSTDDLSKQLFDKYVALQSSGSLNADTVDAMTADIAANINTQTGSAEYTQKNITTFSDSDTAKIQSFAQSLVTLYQQYADAYTQKYPNTTLEPTDPAFAQNARTLGDYYTRFAQALVAIPAPLGAANTYLAYVNAIHDSGVGLTQMGDDKEPLNALLGLQKYIDTQDAQASAIADLNQYLTHSGIVDITIQPF